MLPLSRHAIVIALALTCGAGTILAQDSASQLPFAPIPQGQKDARYHEESQIPPQLMAAIKAAACDQRVWAQDAPVHVFRVERPHSRRIIALAPCFGIVTRSQAFIFEHPLQQPAPMVFPVIEYERGVGATFAPGYLTWNEKDQVLLAMQGSDTCPAGKLRYTYRFEPQARPDHPFSWVLLKAEIEQDACDYKPDEWATFWEAPGLAGQWKPK